jgi:hypothetical protein
MIHSSLAWHEDWHQVKEIVDKRLLDSGVALELVNHVANQVLDENSDEEAYAWMSKMVENVDREDGIIEPY